MGLSSTDMWPKLLLSTDRGGKYIMSTKKNSPTQNVIHFNIEKQKFFQNHDLQNM